MENNEENSEASLVDGQSAKKLGPLRAFSSVAFRLFWFASLASVVSYFMSTIARGWLVLDMTDSAFQVTAINATGMVPTLVFSIFGGVMADRMNRRTLMICSDIMSFLIVVVFFVSIFLEVVELWQIFLLTLIHGIAFALGMPARAAIISSLVDKEDIASAVALFTIVFSSGQMVGPAMAGYLINSYGMASPFMLAVIILAIALFFLFRLQIPVAVTNSQSEQKTSVSESLRQGFSYVIHTRIIVGLILMGVITTVFALPYQTLLPVFARDVLDVGASGLGWLGGLGGAGSIVGSITVASFSRARPMKFLMLIGSIGLGTFIILFSLSTIYLLSLVIVFCVGFLFQIFMASNFTFVQLIAPDHIRGRVLSIRMIAFGLSPIGMILLGTSAEMFGPATATAGAGAISVLLIVVLLIAIPILKRVERSL